MNAYVITYLLCYIILKLLLWLQCKTGYRSDSFLKLELIYDLAPLLAPRTESGFFFNIFLNYFYERTVLVITYLFCSLYNP